MHPTACNMNTNTQCTPTIQSYNCNVSDSYTLHWTNQCTNCKAILFIIKIALCTCKIKYLRLFQLILSKYVQLNQRSLSKYLYNHTQIRIKEIKSNTLCNLSFLKISSVTWRSLGHREWECEVTMVRHNSLKSALYCSCAQVLMMIHKDDIQHTVETCRSRLTAACFDCPGWRSGSAGAGCLQTLP